MTPFLLYIARAGLYLGLFYAFYLLVMRRTTFFGLNRVLLLAGSYLCLLLPVIRLRTVDAVGMARELTVVGTEWEPSAAAPKAFPWPEVLLALYVCGAAGVLTLYLVSAWKVNRLIRRGEKTVLEDCTLVSARREGKWSHYSLNCNQWTSFRDYIESIRCTCSKDEKGGCCCS